MKFGKVIAALVVLLAGLFLFHKEHFVHGQQSYLVTSPPGATSFQNQDFTLQPGLFATAALRSNVYYEVNAVTIVGLTTREEGSPICTAAPVLVVMDLGTSATTAYASATNLASQTLSTSNTVAATTGMTVAVAAGHYVGVGLSAGTCVTPPTLSIVVTLE